MRADEVAARAVGADWGQRKVRIRDALRGGVLDETTPTLVVGAKGVFGPGGNDTAWTEEEEVENAEADYAACPGVSLMLRPLWRGELYILAIKRAIRLNPSKGPQVVLLWPDDETVTAIGFSAKGEFDRPVPRGFFGLARRLRM
jgi:hypothetical protein